MKMITQLEKFFEDGFARACVFGTPDEIQEISFKAIELHFLKTYIAKQESESKSFSKKIIATLELSKSLYNRRQTGNSSKSGFLEEWQFMVSDTCDLIPDNLVVCGLSFDDHEDALYITRFESHDNQFIFRLPLTRNATREGCVNGDGLKFSEALLLFQEIMEGNKSSTAQAKNCITPQQRKIWFEQRVSLDKKLQQFLYKLESNWFCGFKVYSCLIVGSFEWISISRIINTTYSKFSKASQQTSINAFVSICFLEIAYAIV